MTIKQVIDSLGNALVFMGQVWKNNTEDPGEAKIYFYGDHCVIDFKHGGIQWNLSAEVLPESESSKEG